MLAITLCGLCSAAVSPWSWDHHWVWLVPLLVFAAYQVVRASKVWPLWAGVIALEAMTFPPLITIGKPPPGIPINPEVSEPVVIF